MEWSNIIILCSSFFMLLFIGVPISFSIGIASLLTIMLSIPFDAAIHGYDTCITYFHSNFLTYRH